MVVSAPERQREKEKEREGVEEWEGGRRGSRR